MEIYETLFEITIGECELDDYVSFDTTNVDGDPITEQMKISEIYPAFENVYTVKGFSDVENDTVVYLLDGSIIARVLGG